MTWVAVAIGGSAVVGAGAGIYAGNKASKAAKHLSPTELALQQQALQNSQTSSKYGQAFLDQSSGPMSQATNFWNSILNGDRESLATLYGQDISDLGEQNRMAYQTGMELSPRSGMTSSYLSSLPFQRAIQERRIYSSARPQAANALGSLGSNMASLGFSGLGQGSGGAGGLLSLSMDRNRYAGQQGADTGAAVYNLIRMLGDSGATYAKNRGARTGGTSSSSFWDNPNSNSGWLWGGGGG